MHWIWLTFADAESEAQFRASNFAGAESEHLFRVPLLGWVTCWLISMPLAATSQCRWQHAIISVLAATALVASYLDAINKVPSRIKAYFFVISLSQFALLAYVWPTIFNSELGLAEEIIAGESAEGSDVASRLIAATAIAEVRGMCILFAIICVFVIYTPLYFHEHAIINLFGCSAFVLMSNHLVGQVHAGFAPTRGWLDQHHHFAILILVLLNVIFIFRSRTIEKAARNTYLLQRQDEHSTSLLMEEKEEKARVEANMNSWVCHEVSGSSQV
jgi:hypothetical protein